MRTLAWSPSAATSVCVAAAAALALTSPRHRRPRGWLDLLLVAAQSAPRATGAGRAAELMANESQVAAGQRLHT